MSSAEPHSSEDRRISLRRQYRRPAWLQLDSGMLKVQLFDVSLDGLSFMCPEKLRLGTPFEIRFDVATANAIKRVTIAGSVVQLSFAGMQGLRIGARIDYIDDASRAVLAGLV